MVAVVILGVGALGRDDERQFLKRSDGSNAIDQDAPQDSRAAIAGLEDVDVRGRVIQHQGIGRLDHSLRDVGVQVESRNQRNRRADQLPHGMQHFALDVGSAVGHHLKLLDRFLWKRERGIRSFAAPNPAEERIVVVRAVDLDV